MTKIRRRCDNYGWSIANRVVMDIIFDKYLLLSYIMQDKYVAMFCYLPYQI